MDEFQPDVALIGLLAPEIDGVKLSLQLSKRFPALKIVLTGEEIEEYNLQEVLNRGVACDTFEVPFDREDLLDMMKTWAKGLDHIDPATHLRDAKQFEVGLKRRIAWKGSGTPVVFIELFQSATTHLILDEENVFLYQLGATLGRLAAWDGFAYRYGQNQFAMLSRGVNRHEACEACREFKIEVESLLQNHKLSEGFCVAIGLVVLHDDAKSLDEVQDFGRQLIAMVKETGRGGIAAWGVGLIQP